MKNKKSSIKYIVAFTVLLLQFGCAQKLSHSITADELPPEIDKTTLLVSQFEHQDPMVYDPFYLNKAKTDSLKSVTGFSYSKKISDTLSAKDRPVKIEHPLIVKTNAHLEAYNKQLVKSWSKYRYAYQIVKPSEMATSTQYTDKDKYRYMLMVKPILLCILNPDDGSTFLSYRYSYYFFDRKLNKALPEIEVFSPDALKTNAAIIYRLNHLYKA